MPELPYEDIAAVYIIWLSLITLALITNLFQCYKKIFVDDGVHRKHHRLWLSFAILWYLMGSAYISEAITHFSGFVNLRVNGALFFDNFIYFVGITLNFLLVFSIPVLILLAVSLIPAKLQNWLSKATHP
ncbi:hypothetical protein [Methyloglobulus sp.]|uniref:hypothetical protein n=1 Tax=Methyloglobulus sp. TaxID=2518622 RepID=UPI0032B7BCE5